MYSINIKRFIYVFAIQAIIALVLLVVAEFMVRVIMWEPVKFKSPLSDKESTLGTVRYGSNPTGYGDLFPNQDGIWTIWPHRPYHVKTNSDGLRNTKELVKDDKTIRILCIGDSFTFGPYMTNEDTWPGWLGNNLGQRLHPETEVEVLNAGISGYTISDELAYLKEKGLALKPDLIVLMFYPNDIYDLRRDKRRIFLERPSSPSKKREKFASRLRSFSSEHLALYSFAQLVKQRILLIYASKALSKGDKIDQVNDQTATDQQDPIHHKEPHKDFRAIYMEPDNPEFQDYYKQYEFYLREIISVTDDARIPLLVVAFPGNPELQVSIPHRPHEFLARIASETDTPYLDLLPIFKREGDVESLYLFQYDPTIPLDKTHPLIPENKKWIGNGHAFRYGYYVAAKGIANYIIDNGLIEK